MKNKDKSSMIPGTASWIKKYKNQIIKKASDMNEYNFDAQGKIPAIETAFSNPVAKKVAYMIATSHEYKKPNVKAALSFVKNYNWELSTCKINNIQGINKPVIEEKVQSMAKEMKGKATKPLIVVNQFHGIRPQTPGKKILMDGHHRQEACRVNGVDEVPVYKGTYTGNAEKSIEELKVKTAMFKQEILEKVASKKKADPFRTTKTVAGVELSNHVLDIATDIGAASLAAAGGFKGFRSALKSKGLKSGFKSILKSPEFKQDLKTMMKSQKYVLPIAAITSAMYIGKAIHDDKKHFKKIASDEFETFKKSIGNDHRKDNKYNALELKKGINVEHEHTSSNVIAKKIAKDHLDEMSNYYTKLDKMENKTAQYKCDILEKVAKAKSEMDKLKENKVILTPEERKICMDSKAIWHNGPNGSPCPAVWKSVNDKGEAVYVTNTHRAYQTRPTLKGAISIFHSFIKGTA